MKTAIVIATALFFSVQAIEARSEFNLSVNIGTPSAVIVSPPPPPVYAPQVVIDAQPEFIFSPNLGFYVSVGIPYDIVYVDRNYYLYNGGNWYVSPSCQGPWMSANRRIPPKLRRFRYEQIRTYRDREYSAYQHNRDNYRGRWYRPEGNWRGNRRDNSPRDDHRGEYRGNRQEDRRIDYREDRQRDRREDRR